MKQLSVQEKEFSSLYRVMAKNFGLSESSVWVCYFLLVNSGDITQHVAVERYCLPNVIDALNEILGGSETDKNE